MAGDVVAGIGKLGGPGRILTLRRVGIDIDLICIDLVDVDQSSTGFAFEHHARGLRDGPVPTSALGRLVELFVDIVEGVGRIFGWVAELGDAYAWHLGAPVSSRHPAGGRRAVSGTAGAGEG